MKIDIWYTIEKHNNIYTVWRNKEQYGEKNKGGYGSLGLYSNKSKKKCLEYCKENKIRVERR